MFFKQESILVGCVPSAAVAVYWGGDSARGVSARRGVSAWECLPGGCIPACTEADRMTDRQVYKYYLSATSFADGNYPIGQLSGFLLLLNYGQAALQYLERAVFGSASTL